MRLKDPQYAEYVALLLRSKNERVKRDASRALRRMEDKRVVPLLAKLLDDPDREIQYNAMLGIAEATKPRRHAITPDWFTAKENFDRDPERYLNACRAWWEEHKDEYAPK